MKIDQYTCDSCGAVKGVTNHWWRILKQAGNHFSIHPWATELKPADGESEIHLCGERCVTVLVGVFMEGCQTGAPDPNSVDILEKLTYIS
jgi:hypothetical protein